MYADYRLPCRPCSEFVVTCSADIEKCQLIDYCSNLNLESLHYNHSSVDIKKTSNFLMFLQIGINCYSIYLCEHNSSDIDPYEN